MSEIEKADKLNEVIDEWNASGKYPEEYLDDKTKLLFTKIKRSREAAEPSDAVKNAVWQSIHSRPKKNFIKSKLVFAFSAIALLLIFSMWVAPFGTKQASAKEIFKKTQNAIANVPSFQSTSIKVVKDDNGQLLYQKKIHQWYQRPNHYREEMVTEKSKSKALPDTTVTVFDGHNRWIYDKQKQVVNVSRNKETPSPVFGGQTIEAIMKRANNGFHVKLVKTEMIAGRKAYVIEMEPKDKSTVSPELNGKQKLWIDQRTYLPLKREQYAPNGNLIESITVTNIDYKPNFTKGLFTFKKPLDAKIGKKGNPSEQNAPINEQGHLSLSEINKKATFSLMVAKGNLKMLNANPVFKIGTEQINNVTLKYETSDHHTVTLFETKAKGFVDHLPDPLKNGEVIEWKGQKRTLLINKQNDEKSLWWVQDGTYISLKSKDLTKKQIVDLAKSVKQH